jgi:hypothetical protein
MRTYGWTLLAAMACTGAPADKPDDTGASADADADADTDADTDTDVDTDTPTECASSFSGSIDEVGAPLVGADLRLCRGLLCRNGTTDDAGAYVFGGVPPEWHSFEIVAEPGMATALVPILFDCATDRSVDVDVLPLDADSPLGGSPAEHPVGDGLYLTVGLNDLEPPLFSDPAEAVAGVRVPEESWIPFDGVEGTVLAMWYLAPFDYHAIPAGGLPLRIENQWGLADGTALEVYVGSYTDSQWLSAGTVSVEGADLNGAALPLLSTVILVQP